MEYPIVQLDAPENDWIRLARSVERSGRPLWLEAEGEIRGILLPSAQARRLMADYELQHGVHAEPAPGEDNANDETSAGDGHSSSAAPDDQAGSETTARATRGTERC